MTFTTRFYKIQESLQIFKRPHRKRELKAKALNQFGILLNRLIFVKFIFIYLLLLVFLVLFLNAFHRPVHSLNATNFLMDLTICEMIKRNESDVANIVFEILAKKRVQIPLFDIVFCIDKLLITL